MPEVLNKRWMGLREFCNRYGISTSTGYKLVYRRQVPFARCGRKLCFDPEETDAWARARGSAGQLEESTQ